jgi:hypothetical protein
MRTVLLGFIIGAIVTLTASAPADPSTMPANTWVTGDAVRSAVRVGDRLFVGGEFTTVYPRDRYTGALATFPHGVSDPVALPAISGGDLQALTDDGQGGWFVAGTFTRVGSVALDLSASPRLVHLEADGTMRQFAPQGMSGTAALELIHAGGTLMLSYVNTIYAGRIVLTYYYLAAFDAITGVRRAADIHVTGPVSAMVSDQTRIYVFGSFVTVNAESRSGAAAFDIASLALTSWAPSAGLVNTAEIDGTTIYLAGGFTTVNGQSRQGLAALSTSDATLLPWAPSFACAPSGLAASATAVYVAGCEFGPAQGVVSAFEKTTGAALGWSTTADGRVYALEASGSRLFVGGAFSSIAGEPRLHVAAFTDRVLDSWDPRASDDVSILAAASNRVALAGRLTGVGAVPRPGLAEFDARTGALSSWVPPIARTNVNSLSSDGRWLFVHSGTAPCTFGCGFVALALNGTGSITLPQFSRVADAAATADRLYVVGDFGLAGFDTLTGQALPWAMPGHFRKVVATDTAVYVVPYEPAATGHVLKIDPHNGQQVPWESVSTPGPVGELAISGGLLLVGVASQTGSAVLAVSQATGAVVAEAPRSLVPTLDVYPAGPSFSALINPPYWFPFTGGLSASSQRIVFSSTGTLTTLNPATGARLPWTVQLDGPAQSLYSDSSVIVAGGDFAHAGGVASPGLAIFVEPAPAAPTNLTVTIDQRAVTLNWTAPVGTVTGYVLDVGSRAGASDVLQGHAVGLTTSLRVDNVPLGVYFVRVRAINAIGSSPPSTEVMVVVR